MSSSPSRPAQSVSNVAGRHRDHGGEQVLDLVAGHPDQPGWWWVATALGHGGDHQEGVGDHGEGDPAVPGAPAADLMLVQADHPLPVWNRSWMVHLMPATLTRVESGVG
jgi:hypothetical protein